MKTNVIILLSDQQRFDTVRRAGYPHMITPNLDRLMEEGTYFPNAHSTNPVCMPARHDLLTGVSAKHHGYYTNTENTPIKDHNLPTLPRIFSEQGFRTVAVGKMHYYPVREHHGFQEMLLMEELPKRRQDDQYAMYLKEQGLADIQNLHGVRPNIYHIPQNSIQDLAHHGTTWVADTAIDWLKSNGDHPFFMMCGFIQPHPPWNIPVEMDGIYRNRKLPAASGKSRLPHDRSESEWFGDSDSEEQKRLIREAYYTSVTMVDQAVGRILDTLREQKQLDRTVVIYFSDHGEMLQDKGYYSKELPYDPSVRVPLIIRYPDRVKPDTLDTRFADTFDILPTCLDLCGIHRPDGPKGYGESLFAEKPEKDRSVQCSSTGTGHMRWVMAASHDYKYIYHYNGGYEEFFDRNGDPYEQHNLLLGESISSAPVSPLAPASEAYNRLKHAALRYEQENGPDENTCGTGFYKYPFRMLHPSVRGKFHFWSNSQTQSFYEGVDRKERLEKEMVYALSNREKSGVDLSGVFCEKEWMTDFEEKKNLY